MLFISSRLHGLFDYVLALTLVLAPWVIDLSDTLAPAFISVGAGMVILTVSMMTNYELGVARVIPLSSHILIDVALGLFLVVSPWTFSFMNAPHGLHMLAGLALVTVSAFTVRVPKSRRHPTEYMQWV